MQFDTHFFYKVPDRSYQSILKRDVIRHLQSYGFSEGEIGKVNIIISEISSNLVKHSKGGEFLFKPLIKDAVVIGVEMISIDNGPGMKDVSKMMEDGVSTYGSMGQGLGAIKRASDEFDIYSLFDQGTVILSRYYKEEYKDLVKKKKVKVEISAILVPKPGEVKCGDGMVYLESKDYLSILSVDGLGHGPDAHNASQVAINYFIHHEVADPALFLRQIHGELKKTRGAVGSLVRVDFKDKTLSYCGVGNISGRSISKDVTKSFVSYNGILGHNIPNQLHNHIYPYDSSQLLILNSDGLKTRWDLKKNMDLMNRDTSLIAAFIYKENTRNTDDSSIIVCRTKLN